MQVSGGLREQEGAKDADWTEGLIVQSEKHQLDVGTCSFSQSCCLPGPPRWAHSVWGRTPTLWQAQPLWRELCTAALASLTTSVMPTAAVSPGRVSLHEPTSLKTCSRWFSVLCNSTEQRCSLGRHRETASQGTTAEEMLLLCPALPMVRTALPSWGGTKVRSKVAHTIFF